MRSLTTAVAVTVSVAALATAVYAGKASGAVIRSVHAERHGPMLELRFEVSGTPRWTLSRHGNELWLDFGRTRFEIPPRPLFGSETPPLSILRAADRPDGHSRLVVGVTGKADYAVARTGHEILLRLAPAGTVPDIAAPLLAHRPAPPAVNRGPPDASDHHSADTNGHVAQSERLLDKALVVIDPGHGGYDPGTRDPSGEFVEKNLALEISRRVAADLKARGAAIEMTRDSDTFVPLADRTRLANQANADLFVSIHLNSSPNPDASGIEVYYLNNTADRGALRLARIENGGSRGYGAPDNQNLNYILSSLRQNYKAAESASLARAIETQTVNEVDAAFNPGVNPLGARMGPFYVLVGAQMPSVLVECGFLSNRAEGERLADPAYQERMASGIATALIRYLNSGLELGNL